MATKTKRSDAGAACTSKPRRRPGIKKKYQNDVMFTLNTSGNGNICRFCPEKRKCNRDMARHEKKMLKQSHCNCQKCRQLSATQFQCLLCMKKNKEVICKLKHGILKHVKNIKLHAKSEEDMEEEVKKEEIMTKKTIVKTRKLIDNKKVSQQQPRDQHSKSPLKPTRNVQLSKVCYFRESSINFILICAEIRRLNIYSSRF